MNTEKLEEELRENDLFSEDDIRQIISLMFSLNKFLPPVVGKAPSYFNKYLVFGASTIYKSFSGTDTIDIKTYEDKVGRIIDELMIEASTSGIAKDDYLEKAKEKITIVVTAGQQKIIDISNKAFDQTMADSGLTEKQISNFRKYFNQYLREQLKK